ncbi:MAG: hypothetical protein V1720_09035 [bacterium]
MKSILTFILCCAFFVGVNAEDTKYEKAMKKNIAKMDSANTVEANIELSNSFERIALAEKDKWLPYYYASMTQVLASFMDSTMSQKDVYLDKALTLITVADSLQPDESEIYVIKGMIGMARMQIDPMNRYMKYGTEMNNNLQKALELNPANPRPENWMGVMKYYTPEQFGGGAKAAQPVLESSLKKYNEFVPADDLMPVWGKGTVETMLNEINSKLTPNEENQE